MQEIVGIDVGNVIINNRDKVYIDGEEIEYAAQYSLVPQMEDALESIRTLIDTKFGENIYIVSKASAEGQQHVLQWFEDNDFYNKTGFVRDHIYFCLERDEKEPICKQLGITHFIDDRLEVLGHLVDTVPHLYLFKPDEAEVKQFESILPKVTRVAGWNEVTKLLLGRS